MKGHTMITLRGKQENIGDILSPHGTTENYINRVLLTSPGGRTPYFGHRDFNTSKKRAFITIFRASLLICCRLKPIVAIHIKDFTLYYCQTLFSSYFPCLKYLALCWTIITKCTWYYMLQHFVQDFILGVPSLLRISTSGSYTHH